MITRLLREPHPLAHKGNRGKVLIVAGSRGMAGAAILCSRSALRAGAGIVYLAVPEEIQNSVDTANPEVITLNVENADQLRSIISKVDSVAIGPGLGLAKETGRRLNALYAEIEKRDSRIRGVVVDADGLFLLGHILRTPRSRKRPWIITPHTGEFLKLTGAPTRQTSPRSTFSNAQQFAKKTQTILVLKGAHTIISHQGAESFHNSSGNAGMATAGSGDVLTGMIASYLAQGYSPIGATCAAVYIHGRCGDLQQKSGKRIGFTSHDLLDTIPTSMEQQFAF
jgi:NAD(P)H-hydrate epimerase